MKVAIIIYGFSAGKLNVCPRGHVATCLCCRHLEEALEEWRCAKSHWFAPDRSAGSLHGVIHMAGTCRDYRAGHRAR